MNYKEEIFNIISKIENEAYLKMLYGFSLECAEKEQDEMLLVAPVQQ